MFWIKQKEKTFAKGDKASIVFIADKSSSMDFAHDDKYGDIRKLAEKYRAIYPGLRIFVFYNEFMEVSPEQIESAKPSAGGAKDGGCYYNRTFLSPVLKAVRKLNPERVVLVSDGGVSEDDQPECLKIVERMSGIIDCYYCPSSFDDKRFMKSSARTSGGVYVNTKKTDFIPAASGRIERTEQKTEIVQQVAKGPNMAKKVAVATRVGAGMDLTSGDVLNIERPPHLVIDNRQLATVLTGTLLEQQHMGVQYAGRNGAPQTVAIGNGGATVNMAPPPEAKHYGGGWFSSTLRALAEVKPLPAPQQTAQHAARPVQQLAAPNEAPMCSCCKQPSRGLVYTG